ncbi:unnamed protein product [Enterobius vermicularis]|uniref:GLUCAGON domain-containing protein n=1 Tax=Enterobius vermicularis TaxID=51028 RepID=A0A0N4VPY8_ENTVE|nr:unnamed protein product [Enterobius vermicularis]
MSLQPQDLLMTFMLYYLSNSLVTCKKVHGKYDSPVDDTDDQQMDYYRFLYQRLKEDAARHLSKRRHNVVPTFYSIPGPFEPLPGRSHNADYWPLFPFSSQYSGGLDLDPSIARVSIGILHFLYKTFKT